MANDTIIQTHADTVRLPVSELVSRLNKHLGATLVATLADVKDRGLPYKWAKAGGPEPRAEALQRLQVANRVWQLLSEAENDSVARGWFIGANPRLGEMPPVLKLREGSFEDVLAAATAFVEGVGD